MSVGFSYLATPVCDSRRLIQFLYTSTGFVFILKFLSSNTSVINGFNISRRAFCPRWFLKKKILFVNGHEYWQNWQDSNMFVLIYHVINIFNYMCSNCSNYVLDGLGSFAHELKMIADTYFCTYLNLWLVGWGCVWGVGWDGWDGMGWTCVGLVNLG